MSNSEKSALDIVDWCQDLEKRLNKIELSGSVFTQVGEVTKENDSNLTDGSEEKERFAFSKVTFEKEYIERPEVIVSLSGISAGRDYNARIEVYAEKITTRGFEIVMRAWRRSTVLYIRTNWIAVGAIK